MKNKRCIVYTAYVSLALLVLQVAVFIVSWVVTAAFPDVNMRSLLGNEGLRWFFGSFVDNVLSPPLVWLQLVAVAVGMLRGSRLYATVLRYGAATPSERMALLVVVWELVAVAVVVALLAFVPHAVLLSAVGSLWPSSFSVSIVPILAATACMASATYGAIVGAFHGVADAYGAMISGVETMAPYMVAYIIAAELYHSVVWVLAL